MGTRWGKRRQASGALALCAWLYASTALACDFCRPKVQAGIFNEHFLGRLALTLMPLAVVLLLVGLVVWMSGRRSRRVTAETSYAGTPEPGET